MRDQHTPERRRFFAQVLLDECDRRLAEAHKKLLDEWTAQQIAETNLRLETEESEHAE